MGGVKKYLEKKKIHTPPIYNNVYSFARNETIAVNRRQKKERYPNGCGYLSLCD